MTTFPIGSGTVLTTYSLQTNLSEKHHTLLLNPRRLQVQITVLLAPGGIIRTTPLIEQLFYARQAASITSFKYHNKLERRGLLLS